MQAKFAIEAGFKEPCSTLIKVLEVIACLYCTYLMKKPSRYSPSC